MRVYSSRFVDNVLRHGLDRVGDAGGEALPPAVPHHENVRGAGYYH